MLDIIGALYAGALCATAVGVLTGFSEARLATKLIAVAIAAAWCGLLLAMTAAGGLVPGILGPVPVNLLPFGGFLTLLLGGWWVVPRFREALLSVPLPALVGLNAGRLGGLFFLLLYADGRLSAPFAPAAGLGDIAAGALAVPLAIRLALGAGGRFVLLRIWNALGALDLIVAVSLGALSAAGTPFRIFSEGPGTLAMANLPWVLVPGAFVPVFLLIHLAIATKLRTASRAGSLIPA